MNVEEKLVKTLNENEHVVQILSFDDLKEKADTLKSFSKNVIASYAAVASDSS